MKRSRVDWWGNVLFAVGLISVLVGITYGIQPYGTHSMGWTNPSVLTAIIGGVALLVVFVIVETRVAEPMFRVSLFRLRGFTFGTVAALLSSIGRGGLMFMVIIWLQGIWLPLHGYSYRVDAVLGGDLHAAADGRLPHRRADLRAFCLTGSARAGSRPRA